MANNKSTTIPHKLPTTSEDNNNNNQHGVSHHETLLGSLMLRNPNSTPNRVSSPIPNDIPMSSNHIPPIILNSASPNDLNGQVVPSPRANVVVRQSKPRGRPKGSKNKPKAPIYVAQPLAEPNNKNQLLEIQPGSDIMENVQGFARAHKVGLVFLSGVGRVRNVSFRNYSAHQPSINHVGLFDLVSLSGINVGSAVLTNREETGGMSYSYFNGSHSNYLSIVMTGHRGIMFSGVVTGRLIAASTVILSVTTFINYEFHRLQSQVIDYQNQHPHVSGVGSSMAGPSSCPGSSSEAIGYVDEAMNWDPNPNERKHIRFSDY